ncbi:MAG: ATP-dependent Clp protease protease subunit [Clostridium sp.]|jgi:ATP-dependent Clp protease protease subunit
MDKPFWNFKNISGTEGELTLYGDISESSWYGDTISSKQFAKDLKALGDIKNLVVRINSGGGDVFAGHAIYAMLKDHPANVVVKIDGLAASAASVIAMAGNEIIIPSSSFLMIHNPKARSDGEAKDFLKMANTLNVIKEGIVNAYVSKSGKDKKVIAKMMDDETWMTGAVAVSEGFADKVDTALTNKAPILNGNTLISNSLSFDLSNFKTRPNIKNVLDSKEPNTLSFLDKILNVFKDNSQVEGLVNNILENNLPKTKQIENKQEVKEDMEIKNVEELRKAYPNLVNQVIKTEVDAAATILVADTLKNERGRIQAIEKIANKIDPILVNKAKYETFIDAKDLAYESFVSDNGKGEEYLKNLKIDTANSGAKNVPASSSNVEMEETKQEAVNLLVNAANTIVGGVK